MARPRPTSRITVASYTKYAATGWGQQMWNTLSKIRYWRVLIYCTVIVWWYTMNLLRQPSDPSGIPHPPVTPCLFLRSFFFRFRITVYASEDVWFLQQSDQNACIWMKQLCYCWSIVKWIALELQQDSLKLSVVYLIHQPFSNLLYFNHHLPSYLSNYIRLASRTF